MILQHVKAYGRITRRLVVELCKISSIQARDLLARLVKKGALEKHGQKKGAYYTMASKNMDESKIGFGYIRNPSFISKKGFG
jgi:ATP-dependent DNA helicase RecG